MQMRIAKVLVSASIGLLLGIVAFNNITDYDGNLPWVRHILSMDGIREGADTGYRAIHSPWLQHAAYLLIIAAEAATALLCLASSWRMWAARRTSGREFRRATGMAAAGLTVGAVLFVAGFVAIAGEWFGMWMTTDWNAQTSAFRFAIIILAGLLLLGQREDDLD